MEIKSIVCEMKKHIKNLAYDYQDKDDLLQDAMLKVLRSRSYKLGFGPGWIHRVAKSCVLDAHKRKKRERRHPYAFFDLTGMVCEKDEDNVVYFETYLDPFHEVTSEDLDEIPEIMSLLSFEHQEVLLLYASGLTCQEIAHMIGLKEGTVKSRLHYARKYAHEIIDKKREAENARTS